MADCQPLDSDSAILQLRASSADRKLSAAQAKTRHEGTGQADLEKASKQFESLLLNFMIREMRATIPESGLLPRSMAEDIYTSMLDEQYADGMAERGGIGISRMLIDQLKDMKTGK